MSNDLLSCEALEKLIQQEIGELDEIQQKLNQKHDRTLQKEDLLDCLDDSLQEQVRAPVSPSPMGFGRPNRAKSSRNIGGRSKTPKRRIGKKLKAIGAQPINLNKKNVRALVYQDKSASKVNPKNSRQAGGRIRPSRELSISSDEESSQDSNQPDSEFDENMDSSNSVSPNRSSKTLKKKKRDSADIKGIQRRKTKLSNFEARKQSHHHEQSSSNINIRLGSVEPKERGRKGKHPKLSTQNRRNRSRSHILKPNMPTTKPIQSNKGYLQGTKSSHSRVRDKTPKTPTLKYQKPKAASKPKKNLNKSTTRIPLSKRNYNKSTNNLKANTSRSRTPVNKNKPNPRSKRSQQLNKSKKNIKPADPKKKKKIKKTRKNDLIDDDMFNNDDLFAKLNQLTKLNKKIEHQSLIDNGLIDEEKEDLLENPSIELSDVDSEQSDISIPEVEAIENNLRSKLDANKNRRKVRDCGKKKDNGKSFIENQLQQFKEQRRRKIKPSEIDFDRLMNPKHKKKPAELKSECTFQPMLSKKSLNLANKLGNAKERLYHQKSINYSRTPEKYVDKENTFAPKIGAKSKYLDQKKGGHALRRHERLLQMGEKYSAKRKIKKSKKEQDETAELKAHSFRPRTSNFKGTSFDVNLAERASRWAEKRKEKVKRKRQEIEQREESNCSFKPKINHYKRTNSQNKTPESLYSSRFMQDGIKNYFTRLEQARKMKREATDRLENWGRSKSTRKQMTGGNDGYASTNSFQTPVKGQNNQRSQRRTLRRNNSQFNPSVLQENESYRHEENVQHQPQPYTDKSINDTITLLRRNLQGINIHLGN